MFSYCKHKPTLFSSFIYISILLFTTCWDYDKNGEDWPSQCHKGLQTPIDLSPPFTYKQFNYKFTYEEMNTEYLFYHDNNNLILEGDFGYLSYNDKVYPSSHLLFFSPSLHSFKGKKFPLEMQIIHQDDKGNKITVCILFKESPVDYSLILGKLGFDNKELINFEPLKKRIIKERINLSKYISDEKDFFIYGGYEPVPPCDKTNVYFILSDILSVNKRQISNFPKMIKDKYRTPQRRAKRNIYITVPLDKLKDKVAENKRILKENEQRMKKNNNLDKISSTHNDDGIDQAKEPISKDNNNCDELDVIVPFNVVKQKVIAKEKYNKKTDVKLLTAKSSKLKRTMTIDKELPQSEGEIQREILKQKYLRWKNLYLKLTEGNTSIENETQRQIMLFQLNQLEKELKESHYTPYLNFIETTFNKQHTPTSFLQLEHHNKPSSSSSNDNHINNIEHSITNTILSIQMKYDDLSSPYNLNIPSKDDETDYANGMKPKSERDSHLGSIFQVNSWPIDCKRALYLSPINIDVNKITQHIPQHTLQFHLTAPIGNVYVNNDDYKLIVFSDGGFGTVTYYDHIYKVKRIVFHLPSEHTFSKEQIRSEFEMQIICNDDYGNYIGVAVLFEKSKEEFQFLNVIGFSNDNNVLFAKKLRSGERIEIENSEYVQKGMNLNYLFSSNNANKNTFISYVGSTTTPPCRGNVRWFVMVNKVSISEKQLMMFPVLYGRFRNVRGTQGINGRELVLIG